MTTPEIRARWESAASGNATSFSRAGELFTDLLKLMADLHGPNGCPWDREQTLASLRQYIREEANEACQAIDDILDLEEELRREHGMPPSNPAPPESEDKARTKTKGLSIAHHPHRADFDPRASASGAPLPVIIEDDAAVKLDALYAELTLEMGDLLLQAAFLGDLLLALGRPGVDASLEGIITKLVRRHPHVYGSGVAEDSAQVLANWEKIKQAERESGPH